MTALKLVHRFSLVITTHSVFGFPQTLNVARPQVLVHRLRNLNSHDPAPLSLDSTPRFPQEMINHELGDICLIVRKPP